MEFPNDENIFYENRDMLKNMGIFSDCPIGWGRLVRQLFKDIREVCKKHNSPVPMITQVKSKFGCLCFYLNYAWISEHPIVANEVDVLIREAEKQSMNICEITGLSGSYFVKDGWYATLNEDKAIELGYTRAENNAK
jgi:hypothetical protein